MIIGGFEIGALQCFGFVGNLCFGSRFFIQWIVSERAKKSVVPISFWYLSIAGSAILLAYFIVRRDPVGILSYLPNLIPYTRNLILISKERRKQKAGDSKPRDKKSRGSSPPSRKGE